MRRREDLRPVQVRVIEELKASLGLQLIMGMGAGKTVCALTAIRDLIDEGAIRSAIVLAPVRIALTVWPNEPKKWEHLKDLDVVVLSGTPKKRGRMLGERHDVYVCSTDNTQWLIDSLANRDRDGPLFDMLVIDELSRFKNPRGSRAKTLARHAHKFRAIIGLTGTPSPKSLEDQYMPLRIISGGEAWGKVGFDQWRNANFRPLDFRGYRWEVFESRRPEIEKVISTWSLRVPKAEETTVPVNEGEEFDVVVPLTPAQEEDLRKLQDELVVELGADGTELVVPEEEAEDVKAANEATAVGKASQILQGFLYRDGYPVQVYSDAKLKALLDLIEAVGHENIIIVYNYLFDRNRLKRALPEAVCVNDCRTEAEFVDVIERASRGEIRFLLAHAANLGHGIDGLQHGFARIVWYDVPWSSELYRQMLARIARPGQQNPVYSHRIVADHWIERRRIERLRQRVENEEALVSKLETV